MKPETETEKDQEAPMNAELELKKDTPKVIEPDNDKCVKYYRNALATK